MKKERGKRKEKREGGREEKERKEKEGKEKRKEKKKKKREKRRRRRKEKGEEERGEKEQRRKKNIRGGSERTLFRRLKRNAQHTLLNAEGVTTPEVKAVLDESGTSFDDMVAEAFTEINSTGASAEQAGRIARFKSQDIPATRGDITQDFAQQAKEQRLATSAVAEEGEPIRQVRLKQSEAFKTRVDELVDSLGLSDDAGQSLKTALTSRRDLLKAEKNDLYNQVFEANPEIKNVPLLTRSIEDAVPVDEIMGDLAITAGDRVTELETALVRFGINTDEAAVKAFEKGGMHVKPGVVTPLTIGNFDRFRKILGSIERNDSSGAIKVATGPIKRALDKEADLIGAHVKAAGFDDVGITDTLKKARSRVRTLKTEFSKESIAGRLIGLKRDGYTPIIEASKAANEVLKPTAPIETLQRTMKSLLQSGKPGKQAIRNMRAAVVLSALEDALKSTTRKINNTKIVGGAQFVKSLDKFGADKLDILFAGDKMALAKLRNLRQTAFDIEASAGAVPRGSAAVNSDIAMSVLRSSGILAGGLGAIGAMLKAVVRPALNAKGVRKAVLNVTPEVKRVVSAFEQEFPALASTLGIAAVVSTEEETQP